jgi:hypothetical protein
MSAVVEDCLVVARGHLAAAEDRARAVTMRDAERAAELRARARRRSSDAVWFERGRRAS